MPAKWFICPDGKQIEIQKCLKSCRLKDNLSGGRCLSARTLRAISHQREWSGKPTITQLLKGTREAYLQLTYDYPINPQDQLFKLVGTRAHSLQEMFVGADELSEERLHSEITSGQLDFYDPETETLYDTKTCGSFKIKKALGLQQVEVPTGEYYKSGEKKGRPKTRKEWRDGGHKDRLDWAVQLNFYRMLLEEILPEGYEVKHMQVEAIARDGGTMQASRTGIEQRGLLIDINRISNRWLKSYVEKKAKALHTALETGKLPPRCRPRETVSIPLR